MSDAVWIALIVVGAFLVVFLLLAIFFPENLRRLEKIKVSKEGFEIGFAAYEAVFQAIREKEHRDAPREEIEKPLAKLLKLPQQPRVLWVDDMPDNNRHETAALRALGIAVDMATTNDEALRLAKGARYHLVISDIGRQPPETPTAGLRLATLIPEVQAGDTPIVYYTGSATDPRTPDGHPVVDRPSDLFQAIDTVLTCPISPCDCAAASPKGDIASVARYLRVDEVWADGLKGAGIVVGVVDGGITAEGRPVKPGETIRRIPRVVGGWPEDSWGTEASKWQEHGNMSATDVLGMAPDAKLYDLRIAGGESPEEMVVRALQAYDWAINRHKVDGTPHVITNGWGLTQKSWAPDYATNPNHPFTQKVVEAVDEGIIVLFAAGNCGGNCPDVRCGDDVGPGRSIWGANGHPKVMTVAAVNPRGQYIGYSSQGPAALDPRKPDFCGISHFTGYFRSDTGGEAATAVVAGAVALLKQSDRDMNPAQAKKALMDTARDIGPAGWDPHSGAGIIDVYAALKAWREAIRS